ncbi:MAG: hypothetical protein LBG20_02325 [Holosporaceae bacterium]|jgi:NADH-quinone oxidoreductase subunit M|nr:hypothetical protein [Holosporaceae bacterium]
MPVDSILLLSISIPLIGAICISRIDEREFTANVKLASLWTTVFAFIISLMLFEASVERFSFLTFGPSFISVRMIAMTTFLVLVAVMVSQDEINMELKKFHILVLILEALLIAIFSTTDILVFYVLLQLIILITFILLEIFGKDSICAVKFFIILSIGSLLLLLGVIFLVNLTEITDINVLSRYTFSPRQESVIFWTFFLGFASITALFPLHIWLPDTGTETPTALTILLLGIFLKIGTFGMQTILLPIAENSCVHFRGYILELATLTMGYATLAARVQRDLKHIVSYISMGQMALITAGLFSGNVHGAAGASFNTIMHSLGATALLMVIAIIENRVGNRNVDAGMIPLIPYFSPIATVAMLTFFSVPWAPSFLGNFLILSACWNERFPIICLGIGFIIACSISHGFKIHRQIFSGISRLKKMPMNRKELAGLIPLIMLILAISVYPRVILDCRGEQAKEKRRL